MGTMEKQMTFRKDNGPLGEQMADNDSFVTMSVQVWC